MGVKKATEKSFMATVIAYAKLRGWLVYHALDSRGSAAGFPDLVLARGGDLLFAELKVGTNKPTAEQEAWIGELPTEVIDVFVWRPEDWPAIEARLK